LDGLQNDLIEQLYNEMYKQMMAYGFTIFRDEELAEEAVQEAFKIACSKPTELFSSGNPNGWMVKTLRNVIFNIRRERDKTSSMFVSYITLENNISSSGNAEYTDIHYSDLLNSEEYELVKMIAIQKYKMREAADVLGISLEACKKRYQRAKEKMKKILKS